MKQRDCRIILHTKRISWQSCVRVRHGTPLDISKGSFKWYSLGVYTSEKKGEVQIFETHGTLRNLRGHDVNVQHGELETPQLLFIVFWCILYQACGHAQVCKNGFTARFGTSWLDHCVNKGMMESETAGPLVNLEPGFS